MATAEYNNKRVREGVREIIAELSAILKDRSVKVASVNLSIDGDFVGVGLLGVKGSRARTLRIEVRTMDAHFPKAKRVKARKLDISRKQGGK